MPRVVKQSGLSESHCCRYFRNRLPRDLAAGTVCLLHIFSFWTRFLFFFYDKTLGILPLAVIGSDVENLSSQLLIFPSRFIPLSSRASMKRIWDKKRIQMNFSRDIDPKYARHSNQPSFSIKVRCIVNFVKGYLCVFEADNYFSALGASFLPRVFNK